MNATTVVSLAKQLEGAAPPAQPERRAAYERALVLAVRGIELALHAATAPEPDEDDRGLALELGGIVARLDEPTSATARSRRLFVSEIAERLEALRFVREMNEQLHKVRGSVPTGPGSEYHRQKTRMGSSYELNARIAVLSPEERAFMRTIYPQAVADVERALEKALVARSRGGMSL